MIIISLFLVNFTSFFFSVPCEDLMTTKNFSLEHTKPLFTEQEILTIHNLYVKHTFMELFKTLKHHIPIPIYNLFNLPKRECSFQLLLPKVNLTNTEFNFVFKASQIWNKLIYHLLNKSTPCSNGMIIQGSTENSDLLASIPFIKFKLKESLNFVQNSGNTELWESTNFYNPTK